MPGAELWIWPSVWCNAAISINNMKTHMSIPICPGVYLQSAPKTRRNVFQWLGQCERSQLCDKGETMIRDTDDCHWIWHPKMTAELQKRGLSCDKTCFSNGSARLKCEGREVDKAEAAKALAAFEHMTFEERPRQLVGYWIWLMNWSFFPKLIH